MSRNDRILLYTIGPTLFLVALVVLFSIFDAGPTSIACAAKVLGVCFVRPPARAGNSFFGFAEFVQALALLAVIYTVSDLRYRFRLAVAPIPLFKLTFAIAAFIGLGTLLVDVWFAERWITPAFLADNSLWQAFFAVLFLTTALAWMYFAFISPPIFGRYNYKVFAEELFRIILRGSETELAVIAGELIRSAESIVKLSIEIPIVPENRSGQSSVSRKHRAPEFAFDILRMIGNRKFCRCVVSSAPGTAIEFFRAAEENHKYRIPMGEFARNVSTESLINRDSILYHEDKAYSSDLIGDLKLFSRAIYGNFELVEALPNGSPLDLDHRLVWSWDETQLRAYGRAVLLTLESYLNRRGWRRHSYVLYRALGNFKTSCHDVYRLDGKASDLYDSDALRRLSGVAEFIKDAIELIEGQPQIPSTRLRRRGDKKGPLTDDFYDHLANLMFEVVLAASAVRSPPDTCWDVQYGAVWGTFFGLYDGKAWRIIRFKLRRMLYDEVRRLETFPNYKSSRILGFCLNVMGLKLHDTKAYARGEYPLHKALLHWTESNYLRLQSVQPDVAAWCLMGGISFDALNDRLVKTYAKNLNLTAPRTFLALKR